MVKKVTFEGIPFGIDKDSGRVKDVFSVARGMDCHCICPVCKTDLIAKQGDLKVWHFSHATDVKGDCERSLLTSIKMMVRQVLQEEEQLYIGHLMIGGSAGAMPLKALSYDVPICGATADITASVGDYTVALFLDDHNPITPQPDFSHITGNDALIAVKLDLKQMERRLIKLQGESTMSGSFTELLSHMVTGEADGKEWIYHPDMIRIPEEKLHRLSNETSGNAKYITARLEEIDIQVPDVIPLSFKGLVEEMRRTMNVMSSLTVRINELAESDEFYEFVRYFRHHCLSVNDCVDHDLYGHWVLGVQGINAQHAMTENEKVFMRNLIDLGNYNLSLQLKLREYAKQSSGKERL
ncbi:competence protein CoiA family protein [Yersinia intermedia]|uniref:competence protein CoiA family protein n=1 Tax=Yersinia intermedia TaxID=631 RepID=UPI00065D7F89|nr:hypothetical protein [Yersinia intermedia]CRY84205.1 Uncharacterised protein [Yersinia intermedia]